MEIKDFWIDQKLLMSNLSTKLSKIEYCSKYKFEF